MTQRNEPPSRGRSAERVLTTYVIGVFIAAALGAPWLYRAVRTAAAYAPLLAPLAAHPMHRYLQRLLLACALAALPLLLRSLGIRRWRDLGLARPMAYRRTLATGALIGAGTMLAAAALPVAAGARVFDPSATPGRVVVRIVTALAVAPAVALVEELMFRGIIDGGLRRARASGAALAVSSAFYAAVHFLGRPGTPALVTWWSGLTTLVGMLAGLADLGAFLPAFLTLWLVGASLGSLYQRAGTLLANVGVHAGGIFVLQLYGLVTTDVQGADARVWGTGRLLDGWAALGVVLAALGVARLFRTRCVRAAAGSAVELEGASLAA